MTTKDYQERSALRIFLSYFKPPPGPFYSGYDLRADDRADRSGVSLYFPLVYV